MHNRNFEHTPACRESPRYCICHVQNRQGWSSTEPAVITMDNIKLDPLTAGLFKTPIAQEFGPNPTPQEVHDWENSRHFPKPSELRGVGSDPFELAADLKFSRGWNWIWLTAAAFGWASFIAYGIRMGWQ